MAGIDIAFLIFFSIMFAVPVERTVAPYGDFDGKRIARIVGIAVVWFVILYLLRE
jgi:hypothetical protein